MQQGPTFHEWQKVLDTQPGLLWYGNNPATVAAGKAIAHAIMGLLANKDFYLWMLSQGYVYLDEYAGASYNLQAITQQDGIIPSSIVGSKGCKICVRR